MKTGFLAILLLLWITPEALAARVCAKFLQKDPRWVTAEQLEANLAKLKSQCEPNCERDGVFGPNSILWEVSRVPYLALFAEAELYVQLAHPAGAQGVSDYSVSLRVAPIPRFQSTFDFIWRMTYGTFTEAATLARRLHWIHSGITGTMDETAGLYTKGEPYSANDPDALLVVHMSHWKFVLATYEVFVGPLEGAKRDEYWAETRKFGMLMGIPENKIPGSWAAAEQYFEHTLQNEELVYTQVASELEMHFRGMSRKYELTNPVFWAIRKYSDLITANTLPAPLAKRFGLKKGFLNSAAYHAAVHSLRQTYRRLPSQMQTLPIYRMAHARVKGLEADPLDTLFYQYMVGKRPKKAR